MKAGIKADQELENVERQIAQLESVAGSNREAQKQLRVLQEPGRGTAQAGKRKL